MTLPVPSFASPPEDYAPRDPPSGCDPTPKPGVELFRDFVLTQLGGESSGIYRPCELGGPSHHHEGRAWDWRVDASNPQDAAAVDTLLDWLLAPDEHGEPHAMLRRAGIDYIIWDAAIWNARTRSWEAYDGFDEQGRCAAPGGCRSPHRDHVHFSFGWPGARAETSFYDWLRNGDQPQPPSPLPIEAPVPLRKRSELPPPATLSGGALLTGVASFAAGYYLVRRAQRASTGVGKRPATRRV